MGTILLLSGPNLNLLGDRQPDVYGHATLDDCVAAARAAAEAAGHGLEHVQSNHEGQLIDAIQQHRDWDGIIINAGALTHTSLAIADALESVPVPAVEVHLSNIHAREEFRHHSYLSRVAWGQVIGFGYRGYLAALDLLYGRLSDEASG